MNLVVALTTILSISLASFTALASDSIDVTPGLWEINTTVKSSIFQQPQTHSDTECIDQASIQPNDIIPDSETCSISNTSVTDNTLSWSMKCTNEGGEMNGSGSFTSTGDSGSGIMQMSMDFQGQTIKMEMNWQGKRIKSC